MVAGLTYSLMPKIMAADEDFWVAAELVEDDMLIVDGAPGNLTIG